ncbi:5'-methylthioadenosine/adenosylhomocysteine nucleosidase [Actinomyces minihominis]|uniref:5'-methylthioadenosine/adenosylhomocysteine nucleosidase n=1 Tax=Actinomyces minihominis TaxID=2002838 RepID=UPI000C0865F9|nr:5'-methylthioadenosine/adenosylhomocysteine nucleosidase [Actinomyces minihominis]
MTNLHPVIIACAMEEEAEPFLTALTADPTIPVPKLPRGFQGPLTFTAGRLEDHPVIVATTGIGMTNAALAATVVSTALNPRAVVFAGTTGGLGRNVHLGDVVVGDSALYHDADATAFGYSAGQIPQMPETYDADPHLLAHAEAAVRTTGLKFHAGQVSASNSFVTGEQVAPVRSLFPHVVAVDMETAAGAQVCWSFNVPWVSLRAVSDLCDPNANEVFDSSAPAAGAASFEAVRALLKRI